MMRALVLAAAASAAILEPIGYDREGSALAYLTNAGVEATAADVADLNKDAPSLVAMLAMATDAPEQLADLIKASPMSVIADDAMVRTSGVVQWRDAKGWPTQVDVGPLFHKPFYG